jgi:molybdate transport system substrate-binding protein
MYKLLLSLLLATATLFAGKINIAVAANVSYAIEELKTEFKKISPQTDVQVTLGSSGKLVAQIKNGAPYGLLISADMKYPQALYDEKIAITKPIVYAQGELAYFSIRKTDFSKGMSLVQNSNITKIAVANPVTAPYGKAAVEAMKNGGVYESVKSKFVFAESVSQTVAYAVTAADLGFIAKSSLYSSNMSQYKEGINYSVVDSKLYTPIQQGIVLLKYAQNNSEYKAFYNFVLSAKAKEIFKKYGYM